ncbi:MAG TPA: fructosamine kinase family protein [Thermosynechococcaceae cyanobacterium]
MELDRWNSIAAHIGQATGQPFQIVHPRSVSGGCINQGYKVTHGTRSYFVKLNQATQIAMFEAEATGLEEIRATQTIRVPAPVCHSTIDNTAYLVLEWLELGRGSAWAALGEQLAALHRVTSPNGFGWQRDNTIGSTPQPNPWTSDWIRFWSEHRIGFQLRLGQRKGGHFPKGDRLLAAIPDLLGNHRPVPALVHGDLWSGNASTTSAGEPVIFDPATYYGDREVDLAMTELFGGFPAEFYRSYNQAFPLDSGYPQRKPLYNLYHILNHFNLFGGSYEAQANRTIEQLLTSN